MLVFISGGVRSGKSSLAEKLAIDLAGNQRKIYLATARHYDEEITRRIEIHQQNRAEKGFVTIDQSIAIGNVVSLLNQRDTVLLDCLGTLLANEMFDQEQRANSHDAIYLEAIYPKLISARIFTELEAIKSKTRHLIIVSNEVFSDGILYDDHIEKYLQTLALLHIKIAQNSDVALECVSSVYQCHKGIIPKGIKA